MTVAAMQMADGLPLAYHPAAIRASADFDLLPRNWTIFM
jgi:hypothetical protein